MKQSVMIVALVLLCGTAMAQQSASFRMSEHTFNAGGHPTGGTVPTSAGFRISLDAIGTPVGTATLSSSSFRVNTGFTSGYLPPSEVTGLTFVDAQTLTWNTDPNAAAYNLYRDVIGNLSELGFGDCHRSDLPGTTATETAPVEPGTGFFYLVTSRNRIQEEGDKGSGSDGTAREGTVCP